MAFASGAFAAARPAEDQLRFKRLLPEAGLPAAEVFAILHDRRGFMWFGTADGLVRYDGYEFRVFRHRPENPNSLAHNIVRDIKEDAANNLWLATEGGLDLWDPRTERFTHFQYDPHNPASLSGNKVQVLVPEKDGTLWVGTMGDGLNHFDPRSGKFERFLVRAGKEDSLVHRSINTMMYFEFCCFVSRRDAGKIDRHFSAGIMQRHKEESRRDD